MSAPQPRRRRALLLACSRFDDPSLPDLRSPGADVRALAGALGDPDGSAYEVATRIDATSYEAQVAIERFFDQARPHDLHLIYFSGHGIQDDRGELYFAFTNTSKSLPSSTAVAADWVRGRIDASRSRSTVVLIDCCFSGAFLRGMRRRAGADANVQSLIGDRHEGHGVAVLTASGETEFSLEEIGEHADLPARPSYFTEAIVHGIRTGAADTDHDGRITVDELYDYVYERVSAGPSPQRPRRMGYGEGHVVVAMAPARPGPAPAPPPIAVDPIAVDPIAVDPTGRRRGREDGAAAGERIPLAALASLVAANFGVVPWLEPWREQWRRIVARQAPPDRVLLSWLPRLAGPLGSYAAPVELVEARHTPTAEYLTGFGDGLRETWHGAVSDRSLPPPTQPWLTIGDVRAARQRARRRRAWASAGRIAMWVVAAVAALFETAAIAITIGGDWQPDTPQTVIGANLCFAVPFLGLVAGIWLDLRHRRKRRAVSGGPPTPTG